MSRHREISRSPEPQVHAPRRGTFQKTVSANNLPARPEPDADGTDLASSDVRNGRSRHLKTGVAPLSSGRRRRTGSSTKPE